MKQKGFTLVELLVTLAIIGLLGSVVMTIYEERQKEADLKAQNCVLIDSVMGERVHRADNLYKYPIFEAFRCPEGDLIRSRIRYVDKKE